MIEQVLLNRLADYVDGQIAKVVINGDYEITNMKVKEVTDHVLALNYIVPIADVSHISSIELKDESNTTLTSHPVNIPIAADQIMLHTITVKEAE